MQTAARHSCAGNTFQPYTAGQNNEKTAAPQRRLTYSSGQLIFKEGDFGASFYRIKKGTVSIAKETPCGTITLSELGPGDFFGETAAFIAGINARTASAFAKTDVELEALHSSLLQSQLNNLSPMMKFIASSILKKLARTSNITCRIASGLQTRKSQAASAAKETPRLRLAGQGEPWYGKITYRPVLYHTNLTLEGTGISINAEGLRFEIDRCTAVMWQHDAGSQINMAIHLPGGAVDMYGEITGVSFGLTPGSIEITVAYFNLPQAAQKIISDFINS